MLEYILLVSSRFKPHHGALVHGHQLITILDQLETSYHLLKHSYQLKLDFCTAFLEYFFSSVIWEMWHVVMRPMRGEGIMSLCLELVLQVRSAWQDLRNRCRDTDVIQVLFWWALVFIMHGSVYINIYVSLWPQLSSYRRLGFHAVSSHRCFFPCSVLCSLKPTVGSENREPCLMCDWQLLTQREIKGMCHIPPTTVLLLWSWGTPGCQRTHLLFQSWNSHLSQRKVLFSVKELWNTEQFPI